MEKKIGVAIVGYGGMARCWHIKRLKEMPEIFEVVGAFDIDPERNRIFEEDTGIPAFDSMQALLDSGRVDLAIVAVPNDAHKPVCIELLDHKINVICEKPVCLGTDELEEMIAAALETQEKLYKADPKVIDGLKLLKRKKDSVRSAENLQRFEDNKRSRQSVHTSFAHAMKGNQSAVKDLERLSSRFPEAAFFLEYMDNRSKGTEMEWLKEKYPQFKELIISEEYHLNIKDTPFGLFLRAKNLQAKREDWIPQMAKAAKAGSDEALEELIPLMYRPDIKRSVAEVYLARMDLDGLLSLYFDGFDDTMYLEKFCQSDRSLILKVGSRLGERDVEKEMDWYRVNARNGYTECRNELINRMHDKRYRSKAMIYALHDSGADMEAARLYFELEMEGNDTLPSVKWLRKVCDKDTVKDFVHNHYEEKGDMETFESIFTDDGYRKKSFGHKPFNKKKNDKRRR